MLADRGDHRMVLAAEIPQALQHFALLVEFDHAASVEVGIHPGVGRNAPRHAAAEARHAQRKIERRRAHADDRQPVVAVRGAIDVVRIARHVVDDDVEPTFVRTGVPIAAHPAAERLGEEEQLAVRQHANAVREDQVRHFGVRFARLGVVTDDAAVAAALQRVDRPFMHLEADRGFAEIDAAVGSDVEIVGEPQAENHRQPKKMCGWSGPRAC